MVNPLDFVPKLSGFSPMPLGIMAPFMGYQSAALAYNFGLNYEFGKRVIKSMSNEKFNLLAADPIKLNELTSAHHDVLLQAFINEVPKVDKIQDLIIKKMVELEFAKIKVMPELIAQIPKGFIEGIFALGAGGAPEDIQTTPGKPPTAIPKRGPTSVVPEPKTPDTFPTTVFQFKLNAYSPVATSTVSQINQMLRAGNTSKASKFLAALYGNAKQQEKHSVGRRRQAFTNRIRALLKMILLLNQQIGA